MVQMLIPGLSPPAALALDPETTHQPCPHQCSCLVHLWLQVVIEVELVLIGAPPHTHTHIHTPELSSTEVSLELGGVTMAETTPFLLFFLAGGACN